MPTLKLRLPLSLRSGVADEDSCINRAVDAVTDVEAKADDEENSMLREEWTERQCRARSSATSRRVARVSVACQVASAEGATVDR